MAGRISLGFEPPDRSGLRERLRESVARGMAEVELTEQKASFVYGNAPLGSRITKESARRAVAHVRLGKCAAGRGPDG